LVWREADTDPQSRRTTPVVHPRHDPPLASIGDRFTAEFIDGLIALALAAGSYWVAELMAWHHALAFMGWFGYLLTCDGLPGGRSIGKRITRCWVVHVDTDAPCTYLQSLVRNLSPMVFGVIDAAFIAGKQRRRLGDRLARTRVVGAPPLTPKRE
jgi:uncharacterized RDD family membrane protein YckC